MNTSFQNKRVTIMGLGLHGGGSASARFFAEAGALVTVTDLRSSETLSSSIQELSDLDIRFVLEKHDIDDFRNADIVIKNPAVKPGSPYLSAAMESGASIETDISIFLQNNSRPLIAVTGSKGKSTTVSAIFHVLKGLNPLTDLGGNITVSPLTFCNDQKNNSNAPVILELSSWQLADIAGRGLLKPSVCAITNIMHDHQDRYHSMEDYAADKAVIFESQTKEDVLILDAESGYSAQFAKSARSRVFYFHSRPVHELPAAAEGACLLTDGSGFWLENGARTRILDSSLAVKGAHNRVNMLTAAALLFKFGIDPDQIRSGLSNFPGIAHRLEFVRNAAGIDWYNDSAATIPEAAAAAIASFDSPLHLITGGTDKELDFSPLAEGAAGCPGAPPVSISLLAGSGTEKLIDQFKARSINFDGPFDSLAAAVENTVRREKSRKSGADSNDRPAAVLSPGCASFGMFKNEFDRGDQFRELVKKL